MNLSINSSSFPPINPQSTNELIAWCGQWQEYNVAVVNQGLMDTAFILGLLFGFALGFVVALLIVKWMGFKR